MSTWGLKSKTYRGRPDVFEKTFFLTYNRLTQAIATLASGASFKTAVASPGLAESTGGGLPLSILAETELGKKKKYFLRGRYECFMCVIIIHSMTMRYTGIDVDPLQIVRLRYIRIHLPIPSKRAKKIYLGERATQQVISRYWSRKKRTEFFFSYFGMLRVRH